MVEQLTKNLNFLIFVMYLIYAQKYQSGDFVACYIINTEVYEELLVWGMVIDVSPTLEDIPIPTKMATPLVALPPLATPNALKKSVDITEISVEHKFNS